ncbi:uncharacterized protein LOC119407223 [Rhipicephalus sanguineus]|uniref:uncharacterized protein LOC119407223 n=1 Tax=Rhipicephalus sanguineus TaxID=34632 RepID=UPI0018954C64|nr:uncharacterized protein LOC119407223 [Rhipicephalus sanguineus]XP_037530032.1 uncharacterized protein LOC119407223 [Rhipicephalus sanguineus]
MSGVRQQQPAFLWAGDAPGRGKVSDQCLWAACKAMTTGLVLIVIGASMATVGFYSDHLSTVEERRGNSTVRVKNEHRDRHLDSLTYLGPLVMGLGGFIIVATCVMTFEARDTSSSSAKLVSAWFKRSRSYVAPRPEISCQGTSATDVSWERFLPGVRHDSTVTEADRSAVTSALISFSRNLQSSFESGRLPGGAGTLGGVSCGGGGGVTEGSTAGSPREKLHRCQSDPNVVGLGLTCGSGGGSPTFREPTSPLKKREEAERECFLKPPANPQLLRPRPFNVSPHDYRKVVSVDCASPPVLDAPAALGESHPAQSTSSHGSMAMDVYFPEGAVTLKVKDRTKKHHHHHHHTTTAVSPPTTSSRKGSRSSGASSRKLSKSEVGSGESYGSTESDTSPRKSRTSTPARKSEASMRRASTTASSASTTSPRHSHSEAPGTSRAGSSVLTTTKSATMKRHPFTRQQALDTHSFGSTDA